MFHISLKPFCVFVEQKQQGKLDACGINKAIILTQLQMYRYINKHKQYVEFTFMIIQKILLITRLTESIWMARYRGRSGWRGNQNQAHTQPHQIRRRLSPHQSQRGNIGRGRGRGRGRIYKNQWQHQNNHKSKTSRYIYNYLEELNESSQRHNKNRKGLSLDLSKSGNQSQAWKQQHHQKYQDQGGFGRGLAPGTHRRNFKALRKSRRDSQGDIIFEEAPSPTVDLGYLPEAPRRSNGFVSRNPLNIFPGQYIEEDELNQGEWYNYESDQEETPVTPEPPKPKSPTATDLFWHIVTWWIRDLNNSCPPVFFDSQLSKFLRDAVTTSNIAPAISQLPNLLELIYNTILAYKEQTTFDETQAPILLEKKLDLLQEAHVEFGLDLASLRPRKPKPKVQPFSIESPPKPLNPFLLLAKVKMNSSNGKRDWFGQFMQHVNLAISSQNAGMLRSLLPIEPPFKSDYHNLLNQLSSMTDDSLETAIQKATNPIAKGEWNAFADFMTTYFRFIGSVNPQNLLETYDKLSQLITLVYPTS
jgi:hypothetical protein